MIIIFCLRTTRKLTKQEDIDPLWKAMAAGLGYGVFGFLIAGQFVTVTYYPFLWIHLALIVSLNTVILKNRATLKRISDET